MVASMTTLTPQKPVAIFIDGTGNSTDDPFVTNVAMLSKRVDGEYLRGIASESSTIDSHRVRRTLYQQFGRVFALGLSGKVTDAYARLCTLYESGCSLYLFGFSRGACAARLVAGFADEVGVLLKDKLDRVDDAWRLYLTDGDADVSDLREFLREVTGESNKPSAEGGNQLPIHFLGVWDTVAMWFNVGDRPFDMTARLTRVPSNVHHACHALAIHEVRRYFPELLWLGQHRINSNRSIAQVWFPGNHADVGGGYAERDLAEVSLTWMIDAASQHGLAIARDSTTAGSQKNSASPTVHDESTQAGTWFAVGARSGLEQWDNLDGEIQRTTSVDSAYLHALVSGDVLRFQNNIPMASRRAMDRAEALAIQLHILSVFARADAPPPPWVHDLTMDDVIGCAARVNAFVTARQVPSLPEIDGWGRQFALWVLCEGANVVRTVVDTIEGASAEYERRYLVENREGLREFANWLNTRWAIEQCLVVAAGHVPAAFAVDSVVEGLKKRRLELKARWITLDFRTGSDADIVAPPKASFKKHRPGTLPT
jgi:uncharacterized protein (DUF2235 family)